MKSATTCSFDAAAKFTEFRRAVTKGRRAFTDYVDDAAFMIKKQPLRSVGVVFGVALALGALVGRKL